MTRALVLGVGNILIQDEGIGVHALEWLQTHCVCPNVQMVDGGTMGLNLLHYLEGIDHLLILDAIQAHRQPGSIITLRGNAVPTFLGMKISPHQIGVHDLLAVAQLKGSTPPEVVILGVQPQNLNVGLDMSPAVATQVKPLARRGLAQLKEWGYRPAAVPAVPATPPPAQSG